MSPVEFWDMPPYMFFQKVDGYFQRENRYGYHFREMFALQINMNRKENSQPVAGKDIMLLYGEKKEPQRRARGLSQAQMWELADKVNAQEIRERQAIADAEKELIALNIPVPPRLDREVNLDYTARMVKLKEDSLKEMA